MFTLAGALARGSRACTSSSGPAGIAARERFDAGLTDCHGKPRPAYCVVYEKLRGKRSCAYRTAKD